MLADHRLPPLVPVTTYWAARQSSMRALAEGASLCPETLIATPNLCACLKHGLAEFEAGDEQVGAARSLAGVVDWLNGKKPSGNLD